MANLVNNGDSGESGEDGECGEYGEYGEYGESKENSDLLEDINGFLQYPQQIIQLRPQISEVVVCVVVCVVEQVCPQTQFSVFLPSPAGKQMND